MKTNDKVKASWGNIRKWVARRMLTMPIGDRPGEFTPHIYPPYYVTFYRFATLRNQSMPRAWRRPDRQSQKTINNYISNSLRKPKNTRKWQRNNCTNKGTEMRNKLMVKSSSRIRCPIRCESAKPTRSKGGERVKRPKKNKADNRAEMNFNVWN